MNYENNLETLLDRAFLQALRDWKWSEDDIRNRAVTGQWEKGEAKQWIEDMLTKGFYLGYQINDKDGKIHPCLRS